MQKSQSCCWHRLIYCSTVDCFRCRPVCAWCALRAEGLWARPQGRLLWVQGCCTDDSSTGMAEHVSAAHDSHELCFRGQNFVSGGQDFVSGDRTQFQGNFGSADRGCGLTHCTHGLWGLLFSAVKGLEDWRKIGTVLESPWELKLWYWATVPWQFVVVPLSHPAVSDAQAFDTLLTSKS